MVSLPNPLYISIFISIISAIFIYASILSPWTVNSYHMDPLTVKHLGGLTYYAIETDMGEYTMSTFIRYINSGIYFKENESKQYNYQVASLKCICVFVCFQFIYMLAFIFFTFMNIKKDAYVLKKMEKIMNHSFIIYIILSIIALLPFITTCIGIAAACKVGFENESQQEKFTRHVGSGFILHLLATIAQVVSSVIAVVFCKLCKPKDESNYDAF
ncbi:hypothetical protein CL6EHI_155310 [Entamoeba histolytica]|uniref:Uncharacterized protein n=2 Tax=Entamoeba histolytica TaxID=5759 RepID=C4LW84_ENTH1|nr:hypothetical protein EHI_155310 [Entamoeba histolytica HM-1:IMSS]EAL50374.1 hypothetical protein EHI_155310 [Entamoeba histolytica HM-1:IMSS]GAT92961.1 hypothetical protein CL6EHI_155310 [Entamoeba histolytica]|eukprot:XP_655760.1 hypothetical protein EHI_155310 [Entamoeba histolytica HM-1:IMSS]